MNTVENGATAICFDADFLLSFLFDPGDGGDIFL
jgi:hypothetical protein